MGESDTKGTWPVVTLKEKPGVDPKNIKKVVLSIDGGGARCMASVMLLRKLETTIKEQLRNNKSIGLLTYLPEESSPPKDWQSEGKFNIFLADYFDFVAGTSMGAVIAAYIALRGGESDDLLKDEDFLLGCKQFCKDKVDSSSKVEKLENQKKVREYIDLEDYKEITIQKEAGNQGNSGEPVEGAGNPESPADARAKEIADLKNKTDKLKKIFPKGSMRRLEVVFFHCLKKWYPSVSSGGIRAMEESKEETTQRDLEKMEMTTIVKTFKKTTVSLAAGPINLATPMESFLKFLFGDKKTSDLQKDLMVTAFDMWTNEGVAFIVHHTKVDNHKSTKLVVRREKVQRYDPKTSGEFDYSKIWDKSFVETDKNNEALNDEALKLTDLIRGCAAYYPAIPFKSLTIPNSSATFHLIDGAFVSNDPTFQAVAPPADKGTPPEELKNLAVFSIGSGLLTRSLKDEHKASPDVVQDHSNFAYQVDADIPIDYSQVLMIEATSRYVSMMMTTVFSKTPECSPDQYIRIQFGPRTHEEYVAIRDIMSANHLNQLRRIGATRAEEEATKIESFVKKYVLGIEPSSTPEEASANGHVKA